MAVALIDTNVLFASASARDEYHDRAREIVAGIDHGDLPDAVVTDYVVAETLNLCRERLGPGLSDELLDRLAEGSHFELVHVPRADFTAGQRLFRQYPNLSFVDATLVAYADRNDVEFLYSFDDDFDGITEITRLSTAENPYR